MKILIFFILISSPSFSQNLSPEEQRALLQDVKVLKERVKELENKNSGGGFRTTDYQEKTTETVSSPSQKSTEPAMTEEQRKEVLATLERYKKAQEEQQKYLQELEDEN